MASTSSSSSGGLGCLTFPLLVAVIGALSAAYLWSQGADPRTAVGAGLVWGLYGTGGLCVLSVLFVVVVAIIAASGRRRF